MIGIIPVIHLCHLSSPSRAPPPGANASLLFQIGSDPATPKQENFDDSEVSDSVSMARDKMVTVSKDIAD